jgi:hypothetical protein
MSLYAWAIRADQSEYALISDFLNFFDQATFMELLTESVTVSKDDQLIYYIVPKLNRLNLEEYFNQRDDITHFLNAFMALDDDLREGILAENSDFYGYISMILASYGKSLSINEENMNQNHELVHKTQNLITEISAHFDIENEKKLPFNQRNQERIQKIVKLLCKHSEDDILTVMKKEGIIIDDEEESLIHEIMSNPLLKDVQKKYCQLSDD